MIRSCRRGMATDLQSGVVFKEDGKIGIVTLNNPKTLNALNYCMVDQIYDRLVKWEDTMEMVLVEGTGRAFCAGGDVVNVTKNFPKSVREGQQFFQREYNLNYLIANFKVPFIALINGITMGGGVGLSIHGKYRIATDKTMFAMPETAIGLFPDVGVTHFLSRLPGGVGIYLGLTGHRLNGLECVYHGIATHYLDSKDVPKLRDALVNNKIRAKNLDEDLLKFTSDMKSCPKPINEMPALVDQIFVLPTVEEIFKALEKEGSGWSLNTLKTLRKMSPTGLKLTLKAIKEARTKTVKEVLQTDYRLATAALKGAVSKDFYEGVRALLVDKDKNPKWNPSSLKEITDEMVEKCFDKCHDNELEL